MYDNEIEEIIGTAIASNIDGNFVCIWLIAPSGHGKSTMIDRFSEIQGVQIFSGNITPDKLVSVWIRDLKKNNIHTAVIDDLAHVQPRYKYPVMNIIQQLADQKVTSIQHNQNFDEIIPCGTIISCTADYFQSAFFQRMIGEIGLDNRFLKIMYRFSKQRMYALGTEALNGNRAPEKYKESDLMDYYIKNSRVVLDAQEAVKINSFTNEIRQKKLVGKFRKANSNLNILKYLGTASVEIP